MTAADIPADLPRRLRRWADANPAGIRDAVALLTTSGWLDDAGFVAACVVVIDAEVAVVDWAEVATYLGRPAARPDADAVHTLRLAHRTARRAWCGRASRDEG